MRFILRKWFNERAIVFGKNYPLWAPILHILSHLFNVNNFNNGSRLGQKVDQARPIQSHWTKLNQLASQKYEKMVDINKLQAIREFLHVIKWLDI